MGTAVIGGMLAATLLAVFLIPAAYYVIERLSHRKTAVQAPPPSA
jgi:HAE1 family hydrophobic/amphiphilic exporter-1